jgi:NADP-reducing hydrogenase subunit HndB
MKKITSLEDLQNFRAQALEKRQAKSQSGEKTITVGMGSSGIAAGARDTLEALTNTIEKEKVQGVTVLQTGGLGLTSKEPVVQVRIGNHKVTYGNVTPHAARRIIREHIVGGSELADYAINEYNYL